MATCDITLRDDNHATCARRWDTHHGTHAPQQMEVEREARERAAAATAAKPKGRAGGRGGLARLPACLSFFAEIAFTLSSHSNFPSQWMLNEVLHALEKL